MRRFRSSHALSLVLGSLVLAGCGSDSTIAPPATDVRDYIAAITATGTGVAAVFHPAFPPSEGSGPIIEIGGTGAMITGGSAIRTVESDTPFTSIIIGVENVWGYYEITLPTAVTIEELVLTLTQTVPQDHFYIAFAAAGTEGIGNLGSELVDVLRVGTGVVQVSVTWNSSADVDLYVVEPNGEETFYGDKFSDSGAQLDLDSNAACSGDEIRNENITWEEAAPGGTYTVRVNLWDACGTSSTNYVVTVRRKGQPPLTYTGTLTGPGFGGAEGAGEVVTTFTY